MPISPKNLEILFALPLDSANRNVYTSVHISSRRCALAGKAEVWLFGKGVVVFHKGLRLECAG